MIQSPDEVADVLSEFDRRDDVFEVSKIEYAVSRSVQNDSVPEDRQAGWWAERSAFAFRPRRASEDGPWKTYFRPLMSAPATNGEMLYFPDLAEADADVIEYWKFRAKVAKHPVLVARYADLVWDTTSFVTGGKRDVGNARLAIDSYLVAAAKDDAKCGDARQNLGRTLELAMRIGDRDREETAVVATIDYVNRTSEDDKIGTYLYLWDYLLPAKRGPNLSPDQEQTLLEMLEAKFAKMTTPGTQWDTDPHSAQSIGTRLAEYYRRKGRDSKRRRVIGEIGRAFERRAKIGHAMIGLSFLEDARTYYVEAGMKAEAERVRRKSQRLAPRAKKELVSQTIEWELPREAQDMFLQALNENGLDHGVVGLVLSCVPRQDEIQRAKAACADEYPLQALFSKTLVDSDGIKAHVEAPGDPDGAAVFETAHYVGLGSAWLSWCWRQLIKAGMSTETIMQYIDGSPLFTEDRVSLVRKGIVAHFNGDFVQSIHVLIPQIERVLVRLTFDLGGTSVKSHRSGRAVTQAKSLNDALNDEAVIKFLGPDLRMYLVATLSHPKGINIRNNVCHGLWTENAFSKCVSERVLHVLLSLACMRQESENNDCDAID